MSLHVDVYRRYRKSISDFIEKVLRGQITGIVPFPSLISETKSNHLTLPSSLVTRLSLAAFGLM
jgi:hypothetical protein